MNKDDKWLRQIKDKVDSYEEVTPPLVWDKVASSLSKSTVQPTKKIIPLYRKVSTWAVAAALLIGALSFLFLGEQERIELQEAPQKIYVAEETPSLDELKEGEANSATSKEPITDKNILSVKPVLLAAQILKGESNLSNSKNIAVIDQSFAADNDSEIVEESSEEIENTDGFVQAESYKRSKTAATRSYDDLYGHLRGSNQSSESQSGNSQLGVNLGGSGGLFNTSNGSGMETRYQAMNLEYLSSPDAFTTQKSEKILIRQGIPYVARNIQAKKYKHRQPISFGLNYSHRLSNALAVESGLIYTFLSSDVTDLTTNDSYKQKFHYLGVPIKLNWTFFRHNDLALYAAGGGTAEIAVAGKVDGKNQRPTRPQFSAQAGVGLQYSIARHIGLYIEPGVSYYFKDGGKYETIRTEKPFNFNLSAGFRLLF